MTCVDSWETYRENEECPAPLPCLRHMWSKGLGVTSAEGLASISGGGSAEEEEGQGLHVYMDGAGRAALPDSVIDVGSHALSVLSTPWEVEDYGRFTSKLREAASKLLGVGTPDEISITPSTAQALSTVAAGLHLEPQEFVVVLESQSASNVMMWQALIDRCPGSFLRVAARPPPGGGGPRGRRTFQTWTDVVLDAISGLLDEGGTCGLVALPQAHWSDGAMIDLEAVAERCREVGALLVLDLTQTIGAMPFHGAAIKPDAVAFSVHKWLHGPHGASLLYVAEGLRGRVPPLVHHDRNRLGSSEAWWDEEGAMTGSGYPTAFLPEPGRRYDGGGRPSPLLLPMMAEGARIVTILGPARVSCYCEPLTAMIAERARVLGFFVPPRHAPHFVGLRVPDGSNLSARGAHPATIAKALGGMGFHVSVRAMALRVSVYVYTTPGEVEAFCGALERIIDALPPL